LDTATKKQEFVLDQSFATRSSKFMQTAPKGERMEAREKCVLLPEAYVANFEVYMKSPYTGQLISSYPDAKAKIKLSRDDCHVEVTTVKRDDHDGPECPHCWSTALGVLLIRLYILGACLDDSRFCNAVADALVNAHEQTGLILLFKSEVVDFAWEKAMLGSTLRATFVNLIINDLGEAGLAHLFLHEEAWLKCVCREMCLHAWRRTRSCGRWWFLCWRVNSTKTNVDTTDMLRRNIRSVSTMAKMVSDPDA
jgi:hypothetical protein